MPSNEVAAQSSDMAFSASGSNSDASLLSESRGISIASLVLGIASIPLACFVLGIIGVVLASHAQKVTPSDVDNRFARTGKICSIIGIVVSMLVICAVVGVVVSLFRGGSTYATF